MVSGRSGSPTAPEGVQGDEVARAPRLLSVQSSPVGIEPARISQMIDMLQGGQGQRAEGEAVLVLHQFPQHVRILWMPLGKMRHGSIDLPEQVQGMLAI